jgi:hypothetical protein
MTGHAAGFVHDEHARILMDNFERKIGIRLDCGPAIRRGNLDSIFNADDLTLPGAPPVDSHQPALDQLLRDASRRRKSSAHEIMIEPFF